MNREILLEGLSCANCAAKIERQVQALDGVASASLDFVTQRLTIEVVDAASFPRLVEQASRIATSVEPEIVVVDCSAAEAESTKESDEAEDAERIRTRDVLPVVAGFLLFLAALVFTFPPWLDLTLFLAAYVLVGGEVVVKAVRKILRGQVFDEHFLMSVATLGAFAVGEPAEAVAVMLFYQVGDFLQTLAVHRSRRSIRSLMDIRPDHANLRRGVHIIVVRPEEVHVGDTILVKPGERIPLDGTVREGRSSLDTSAITGESMPRDVAAGDEVLSGSINRGGLLEVEVTQEFGASTVARILDLVQHASAHKAPTESFITRFARFYTPVVVFAALALAVLPPLLFPGATFGEWIHRALVFLVISCPCALVISIPLGFFGGIGAASRHGILFKGGNYLEAMNAVDTVVFDKTGTLTKGVFEVTRVHSLRVGGEAALLEAAAQAEAFSSHPIALSILHAYGKPVDRRPLRNYEETPGLGTRVEVEGRVVFAGSARFLAAQGVVCDEPSESGTVVHVAADGAYLGHLVVSDELRADAVAAIHDLRAMGIRRLLMFTGDTRLVGEDVGRRLGLDEVCAGLLPDGKVAELERLEAKMLPGRKVLFIGDGVNDAPVLMRADVGMAMGGLGSDAAIAAADVVLMTDEPSKVAVAIRIARRTRRIVWQNIAFALGVKGIFLLLGAFGVATLWEAVFADVGVTLLAVLNAMRVLRD
jgi:Cd2+/Zn2+-exporting ATPase